MALDAETPFAIPGVAEDGEVITLGVANVAALPALFQLMQNVFELHDLDRFVVPDLAEAALQQPMRGFGGEDALATIYYRDALLDLAVLEEEIAAHPEWGVTRAEAFAPADLRRHAREVRAYGRKRFWNATPR